ncbi:MAG: helicase HerA-like domain-containing protein [Bosea sp. (in: a-proteobacteria)]
MADDGTILIGKSWKPETLLLKLANRHGLVTGATGTGKTVTLQVLAEGFARHGVPVFAADIKGDLSGIAAPGDSKPPFVKRAQEIGVPYEPDQFTTVFWDVFGEQGHPVRATISEMGPLLLSRLLDLNETQEGVLNIAFRIADEQKMLLLDLKDLRAILSHIAENAATLTTQYGNVSAQSVGAIQRQLLVLENQKGQMFFGEPALEISDLMRTDRDGRGVVNIMAADKMMANPRLYATFLLWLLSELFEQLPEVGDLDKPKLVFFFDEAHLLFNGAPKVLLTAVEQVVRLIRSKGVGVYFVTQNPLDIPDTVLAQLGNRVQHALRAFTPRDQKAVRAAAETFRQNPKFKTEEAIMQLAVGEALTSTLEGKGTPTMVERTLIAPAMAQVGPITPQQRQQAIDASPLKGKYETMVDRESAYEMLMDRKGLKPDGSPVEADTSGGGIMDTIGGWIGGATGGAKPTSGPGSRGGRVPQTMTEKIITSAARSVASSVGRQIGNAILRGVLGSMTGKR